MKQKIDEKVKHYQLQRWDDTAELTVKLKLNFKVGSKIIILGKREEMKLCLIQLVDHA